jgi:GntR family transcriptional regulator, rspAB operon transcriptional repressor
MSVTKSDNLKPVGATRVSLTQLVANAVQKAITSRELTPGTRITESDLAARLQVSKTPVREALLRLQFMGIIEPDGARGGRIVMPSDRGIREAYELREALEIQAAKLAAGRVSEREALLIRSHATDSLAAAQQGHVADFRRADREFHRAVADASSNQRLASSIDDALVLTWTLRLRDVPLADDSRECAQQHVAIADAIGNANADLAAQEMGIHIRTVRTIVVAAFREAQGVSPARKGELAGAEDLEHSIP